MRAMRLARIVILGLALLALPSRVAAGGPAADVPADSAAAAADPLGAYLRGLADSTDAYFGTDATSFDTTGLDSIILRKEAAKPEHGRTGGRRVGTVSFAPRAGYHRATGHVLGAGATAWLPARTTLAVEATYGFSNHEGRYRVEMQRSFARGRGADSPGFLLGLEYGRETMPFAPEHETRFPSWMSAFFTGRNAQGVYENRGGGASLAWRGRDRFVSVGWRSAHDEAMPRRSDFPPWGDDARVPGVTPAREGGYREGIASAGTRRLVAEGRYTSSSRWRARAAGAHSAALMGFEAHLQVEAGSAASAGPPQHRFELGGAEAVPTLKLGGAAGNRLSLGKLELVHGMDLTRALRLSSLRFLALHPAFFVHEGAAWSAADGDYDTPPDAAWRGAAGIALVHIPGFPRESTHVRLQVAWPLGPDSGSASVSLTVGDWFDLAR